MNAQKYTPVYRNSVHISQYFWYGIFILWGLFMMDVITTEMILSFGGYEMNALMKPFVSSVFLHTVIKMGVLALIVIVAYISDIITKRYGTIAIMAISAWYLFVITNNVIQVILIIP